MIVIVSTATSSGQFALDEHFENKVSILSISVFPTIFNFLWVYEFF